MKMKNSLDGRKVRLVLAAAALGSLAASPAQAGFQWVAPIQSAATAPVPDTAPSPVVTSAPITPVVIEAPKKSAIVAPAPVLIESTPAKVFAPAPAPVYSAPVAAPVPVVAPAPIPVRAPAAASVGSDFVQGFADQVPLAVAMRQVLPNDYSFTAAEGVDQSTLVSWQGGRSWRDVMNGMLSSSGMAASVNDHMVVVEKVVRAAPVATPAPIVPAPVVEQAPVKAAAPEPAAPQPEVKSSPTSLVPIASYPQRVPPAVHTLKSVVEPAPAPVAAPAPVVPAPSAAIPQIPVAALSTAPAVSASPVVAAPSQVWDVRRGETLKSVLEAWCRQASVELYWSAEYDYPVKASLSFSGTFEEAVRDLLSGFQEAKPQPFGQLHRNAAAGQATLVVQAHGNHYGE